MAQGVRGEEEKGKAVEAEALEKAREARKGIAAAPAEPLRRGRPFLLASSLFTPAAPFLSLPLPSGRPCEIERRATLVWKGHTQTLTRIESRDSTRPSPTRPCPRCLSRRPSTRGSPPSSPTLPSHGDRGRCSATHPHHLRFSSSATARRRGCNAAPLGLGIGSHKGQERQGGWCVTARRHPCYPRQTVNALPPPCRSFHPRGPS